MELSCTAICCRVRLFMVVLPVIFGYFRLFLVICGHFRLFFDGSSFMLWIKKSITLHDYALTAKLKKSFV